MFNLVVRERIIDILSQKYGKVSYPDTYNFLCSIRDGLSDMGEYL